MADLCADCRAYVDRLLQERSQLDREKTRWLDTRFAGIETRFIELQRAIDKTESQIKDKFEQVNHMRAQLDRQAGTFMLKEAADRLERQMALMAAREYVDDADEGLSQRVSMLEQTVNNWQGRLVMLGVVWSVLLLAASWALQHVRP